MPTILGCPIVKFNCLLQPQPSGQTTTTKGMNWMVMSTITFHSVVALEVIQEDQLINAYIIWNCHGLVSQSVILPVKGGGHCVAWAIV